MVTVRPFAASALSIAWRSAVTTHFRFARVCKRRDMRPTRALLAAVCVLHTTHQQKINVAVNEANTDTLSDF